MAATDKSYLEWHGQQWRVTVKLPPLAKAILGKSHLKYPLGTDSLAQANLTKMTFVQQAKRTIAAVLSGQPMSTASDPLAAEAKVLRGLRRVERELIYLNPAEEHSPAVLAEIDHVADLAADRAEEIEAQHGAGAAVAFYEAATGKATPLGEYIDVFVSDPDVGYVPKSVMDLRRAITRLGAWMRQNSRPVTLQAVDRSAAQEYLRYLRSQMAKKSFAKYRSFLSSYWDWMQEQGYVAEGAGLWEQRTRSRRGRKDHLRSGEHGGREDDGGKRPFTKKELQALLSGEPSRPYMADLIRIAALSGMRIEEIFSLRVQDCAAGVFNVRGGKTAAATRKVPIHSDLKPIIARLARGVAKTAFLLDPRTSVSPTTGLRSGAATKAFTRYRRDCGVDERPNDKAKSNVDFHSLRRWFITEAEAALGRGAKGYTPMTIADVVGHETSDLIKALPMTMGVYRGKAAEDARRACVQAVRLPTENVGMAQ